MVKRSDKYAWHVGSPPPPIDPHSLVKHQIVKRYLERYIQVLMSNYVIDKLTLSIVDGFACGGEYLAEDGGTFRDDHHGRALTMLVGGDPVGKGWLVHYDDQPQGYVVICCLLLKMTAT